MLAALGAEDLDHHAVEVQPFHQHPGEGAEEEVVQEHGQRLARDLGAGPRQKVGCLWVFPAGSASQQPFPGHLLVPRPAGLPGSPGSHF